MDVQSLREKVSKYNQGHLLQYWESLSESEQEHLYKDITSLDLEQVSKIFIKSQEPDEELDETLLEPLPFDVHESVTTSSEATLRLYREEGLRQIANGKVAVLLLAGGQGTRLGVNFPKGMYNVGLPSGKTLYQLQGERLRRLEQLAVDLTGQTGGHIPWYIMTSEQTKEPTEKFFDDHNYFGLEKENVVIFEQATLPCFTFDGKIILDTKSKIARAPDGNGGLYAALRREKILDDMELRDINYVHVYGVDNILVKIADPTFMGYCIKKGAEAGAKVVEKSNSTEAVGIICKVKGEFQVVEYSEITTKTAEAKNADGKLTFNAGSICNHFFTVDFLKLVSNGKQLKHHVAKKKIPYIDPSTGNTIVPTEPNGIKLEKFVFDVFHFTSKFVVWEVLRDEEFSPMKNAIGAKKDTPVTARNSLYKLHQAYISRAGGILNDDSVRSHSPIKMNGHTNGHYTNGTNGVTETNGSNTNGSTNGHSKGTDAGEFVCEISPLVSYDGEGLRGLVEGIRFRSPVTLLSDEEKIIANESTNGYSVTNGKTADSNGCIKTATNGCTTIAVNGVR